MPRRHLMKSKRKWSLLRKRMAVSILYPSITIRLRLNPRQLFSRNFERSFTPRTWLRSASNFAKARFRQSPTFYFSTPKKQIGKFFGSKNQFFINLARFSWSWSQMDIKISFSVKFCFRYKYSEVCTTKNYENVAKTLWKCCENDVKTLWNPCENLMKTLWKPYENLVKTLWKPCENLVKMLWKCWGNVVKMLWKPCENLVKTLWKPCANLIKMLKTRLTIP